MGILKLENVGYRYKDAPKDSYVFKDINYEFEQGKMYAIKGKSGSGKTTLLSLITGLENFEGKDGYYVFHAGTKKTDDGIVTNGGRVLGITAKGTDLKEARANAYKATEWVEFENKYMRSDIGKSIDKI